MTAPTIASWQMVLPSPSCPQLLACIQQTSISFVLLPVISLATRTLHGQPPPDQVTPHLVAPIRLGDPHMKEQIQQLQKDSAFLGDL